MIKLVPAICPCCGAKLDLDDNMKRAECIFCKNTIIVDDAIEKFKTDFKGNLMVSGIKTLDQLIEEAKKYYKVGDYDKAIETSDKIFELDAFNEDAIVTKTNSLLKIWDNIEGNEEKLKYDDYNATRIATKIRDNYENLKKIMYANDVTDKIYDIIGKGNLSRCEYIISILEKYEKRIIKFHSSIESKIILGSLCFIFLLLIIAFIVGAINSK